MEVVKKKKSLLGGHRKTNPPDLLVANEKLIFFACISINPWKSDLSVNKIFRIFFFIYLLFYMKIQKKINTSGNTFI